MIHGSGFNLAYALTLIEITFLCKNPWQSSVCCVGWRADIFRVQVWLTGRKKSWSELSHYCKWRQERLIHPRPMRREISSNVSPVIRPMQLKRRYNGLLHSHLSVTDSVHIMQLRREGWVENFAGSELCFLWHRWPLGQSLFICELTGSG